MKDLYKLEEIYEIFNEALRDIEDVAEDLSDHDLGCKVDKIYKQVDGLQTDVYRLIEEMENKQWKEIIFL